MRYLFCILLSCIGLGCRLLSALADDASDTSNAAKVDGLFKSWNRSDSPGCALGIIRDGKLVVARGYGTADLDHDIPITTKSVFEVGSMTKSFTCACLAILMDQGKLKPEDDLRKFVPEMPHYDTPVTIRHLIRCECGLRDYWFLMQLAGWNINGSYTNDDVLALLTLQKAPTFEPGSQFAYTNSAYFLLGLVVERIEGKPLSRFMEESLFQPLAMTDTYLEDDPSRITKKRVVGYEPTPDGHLSRWIVNSRVVGAMGIKTTIEDMVKWDQNFFVNRLPEGPRVHEFLQTGTLLDNRNVLDASPTPNYRGLRRMAFTGGLPGFIAAMTRFPDQKFTVICLANDWSVNPLKMTTLAADVYLGDKMAGTVDKQPETGNATFKFIDIPEHDLVDKVGAYRMKRAGMIWKVAAAEKHLEVTDYAGAVHRFRGLSTTRFRAPESPSKNEATLVFERSTPERQFGMRLERDDGSKVEFEPIHLVTPNAEQLTEYAGRYYNDELNAIYSFTVRDGSLFLQVNNHRLERFSPTVADEFMPHLRTEDDGRIVNFIRDANNQITSFAIELGRIKIMKFKKLAEASK